MSKIIYDVVLIALFIVYLARFREKSLLFSLGVCWFFIEILSNIAYIVFYETVRVSPDLFGDNIFDLVNYMNICSVYIRFAECVLLFLIVLCFFVQRQKVRKSNVLMQ